MQVLEPAVARRVDPKKLRAAREEWGWTVDDAVYEARKRGLKISRQAIIDLESGRSGGTVEKLCILAEVYGVRLVDKLLTD